MQIEIKDVIISEYEQIVEVMFYLASVGHAAQSLRIIFTVTQYSENQIKLNKKQKNGNDGLWKKCIFDYFKK